MASRRAPRTTCSKAEHVFRDDEFTFALEHGLTSGRTGLSVFVEKGGRISELASSEYTVNSAAGTVRLTEKTMLKHRQGLGPAQVVISHSTADGTRTIAGVGRIQFTSPVGWDWLPEASCR